MDNVCAGGQRDGIGNLSTGGGRDFINEIFLSGDELVVNREKISSQNAPADIHRKDCLGILNNHNKSWKWK